MVINNADGKPAAAEVPGGEPVVGTARHGGKTGILLGATVGVLLAGLAVWGFMALASGSSGSANDDANSQSPDLIALKLDAGKPKEPVRKALDPRVQKAVDAGVAYLRTQVETTAKQTVHQGAISLMGLTLLECGVSPDDADVRKLADVVRSQVPKMHQTYTAAPAVLFLDRLHQGKLVVPEEDRQHIRSLTLRLIAGQHRPHNLWSYGIPEQNLAAEDKLFDLLSSKPETQDNPKGLADLSNTQFAALALWVGRKHGLPVNPALRAAAATARNYQNLTDGTLPYNITAGGHRDTGACVGLILLALGRAVADDKEAAKDGANFLKDPAVVRSLKHLEQVIAAPHNPPEKSPPDKHPPDKKKFGPKKKFMPVIPNPFPAPTNRFEAWGDLYFLWTLERTALILGLNKIGEHDWHKWGSDIVLDLQKKDSGMWAEKHVGVPDTCFALLFLMRANLFQDLTDKLNLAMMAPSGVQLAMNVPTRPRE